MHTLFHTLFFSFFKTTLFPFLNSIFQHIMVIPIYFQALLILFTFTFIHIGNFCQLLQTSK